ncbi:MAG: hypothetical protein WC389_15560 [Lutibacter sp.]|jgi:hypothetical protein
MEKELYGHCTQGLLNKKDIENIKILTSLQSEDIREIFRGTKAIELKLESIIAKLDEVIRDNNSVKVKVDDHIEGSEERIKENDRNTSFRKVGCWAIGVIYIAGIGALVKLLFSKGA